MIIFNDPLYACFVTPILCKDLSIAGLTKQTPYQWKIRNNVANLFTDLFDIDDYYKETVAYIDSISKPEFILPAYNIKDVEAPLLPLNYMLTVSQLGEYEVSTIAHYDLPMFKAPRMPDAYALLLLEAIRKGVVAPEKANQLLTEKIKK